jgi:hypothetical protein
LQRNVASFLAYAKQAQELASWAFGNHVGGQEAAKDEPLQRGVVAAKKTPDVALKAAETAAKDVASSAANVANSATTAPATTAPATTAPATATVRASVQVPKVLQAVVPAPAQAVEPTVNRHVIGD